MEAHPGSILHLEKIHHDMVMLRRQLHELKRNGGLLCSEALHHQLKLTLDNLDQRLLGPNTVLKNLRDTYLVLMDKRSELQQKVSLSGLSEVKVDVKRVLGFIEEPDPLPHPEHRKRQLEEDTEEDSMPEKGVFKVYETEGTIGDTAYAAAFIVKNSPDQEGEKVAELLDLRLGTQSTVTKKMLTPARVTMPDTVLSFTTDLYYHKVLHDERLEALNYLKSEVAGVEVVRHTEPVILQLVSHGQHQVEMVWDLVWDNPNSRFKNSIAIDCTEEVVTRYSRADIYPYLSRQQKLVTPQDVIDFAEAFTDL